MTTTAAEHEIPALDTDRMYQTAEILLKARREVMPIHELPVKLRPHSLDEAYCLQDIVAEAMGPIGGWKIGYPSPDATPIFSPMPVWGGFAKSGDRIAASFKRMRGVEAEIAFCIGKDLPPRNQPYSREEVLDAIASAHPAIELLESAYFDPDKVDRLSLLGDLLMNGGFAHGAAVPDWQNINLADESVTVTIDGAEDDSRERREPGGKRPVKAGDVAGQRRKLQNWRPEIRPMDHHRKLVRQSPRHRRLRVEVEFSSLEK